MSAGETFYFSESSALSRFFLLREGLAVAGSQPMNPDDCIKGTRMSTDRAAMLELLDLGSAIAATGIDARHVSTRRLYDRKLKSSYDYCVYADERFAVMEIEYTLCHLPVEGPRFGANKCEETRRRCERTSVINGQAYMRVLNAAKDLVRQELESRCWIPPKRQGITPLSSVRSHYVGRTTSAGILAGRRAPLPGSSSSPSPAAVCQSGISGNNS